MQYVSVSEKTFARGINQLAAEDSIPEGFVEDLVNADANPDGLIEKRTGYVGHLGGLPLRVVKIERLPGLVNNLCLTFDDAVSVNEGLDLGSVPAQPVVLYGKTSTAVGPFSSSGYISRWYPTFSANARKTYTANTLAGTVVQTAGEHASSSPNMLVQVTESLSALNKSNSLLFQGGTTQGIAVDTTSRDITVQYGNLDPADVNVFVFVKEIPGAGTGYTHSFSLVDPPGDTIVTSTITILAATHGLNSFNIIAQVFQQVTDMSGTYLRQIVPSKVEIDSSTGAVTVTIEHDDAIDGRVQLYTPPVGQQLVGALQGSGTTTVVLPKPDLDFPLLQVYLRSGSTDELVIPDSVETDVDASTITVTFQNSGAEQYVMHYDAVDVRVNKLCVTDSDTGSLQTDSEPEVVVYGLPHGEVYESQGSEARRDGWVHHIDSYVRVTAEQTTRTLVAGLGWNFFTEQARDSALRIPLLYPRLRSRVDSVATLAPAFGYPERTRGHFSFTGDAEGWTSIQSITYASAGRMIVTLSTPGISETGTPLRTLLANPTSAVADTLTVQGAEFSALDGEWPIYSYAVGADTLALTVLLDDAHPDLTTGGSGLGGVFSDVLPLDSQAGFLPGDLLYAPALPEGSSLRVLGRIEAGTDVVVGDVSEPYELSAGQLVTGQHEGRIFGARNLDGTVVAFSDASFLTPVRTDDIRFVRGDAEGIEYPHPFAIQHVLGTSVPLTSYNGTTKELTLASPGDATKFAVGQWIALDCLGRFSCECQIEDITPTGELVLTGGPDGSYTLTGQSILSGLSLPTSVTVRDDSFNRNYFVVDGRWLPIEQPTIDNAVHTLAAETRTKHLTVNDYGTQPYVRSTTIANNIYLTNGQDPVLKYDGVGIHRAGFYRYQAEATLTLVTHSGGELEADKFYRYYIRYEAIDQNGNVVTLAATGSEDLLVETANSTKGTIYIRCNNLPDVGGDNFEYDRLFVSLYRTSGAATAATTGTLYLVERKTVTAAWNQPYVSFVDNYRDSALRELDNFASIPGTTEFATLTEGPLRAKHITTLSNVLVLANTSSWPRVRMQIQAQSNAAYSDLSGKKFRLRKDTTSTATTTDMTGVVNYEYVTSAGTAASATVASGVATVSVTGTWAAGDWIYLSATTTPNNTDIPRLRGWYMIETGGTNTLTVRDASLANGSVVDTHLRVWHAAGSKKDVPIVLLALDQNWTDSIPGSTLNDVVRQTSIAINASMRAVNRSVSGMTSFAPWVISNGGGDYTQGALVLEQPYYAAETFSFEQVSGSEPFTTASNYSLFVEGFAVTDTTKQLSLVQRYPSRIHLSKVSYPETFYSNTLHLDDPQQGDSLDINAADGQEITAVIPFFGTSTAGQGSQDAKLVVFKTNSVYFVDLTPHFVGESPTFQLIQTQGLGCGAPYSPAYVQGGIMFANEAGIYKLSMGNDVTPHGQFIERIWKGEVNRDQLAVMQGHNFATGRRYKLSVPMGDAVVNSDVLVYNYTAESRGQFGSWSRYDAHPATGWCNLLGREYFGSTSGRVYTNRASSTRFDYADAAEQPIQAVALLRTTDFGDASVRKRLLHVTAAYRAPRTDGLNLSQLGTALSVAVDQRDQFTSTQLYTGGGKTQATGLGDQWAVKGDTLRYSVAISKARYFQVRVENATLYEPLELTGITYRVAGLTTLGTKEAADSGRTP
jgi:hypothetical protein